MPIAVSAACPAAIKTTPISGNLDLKIQTYGIDII